MYKTDNGEKLSAADGFYMYAAPGKRGMEKRDSPGAYSGEKSARNGAQEVLSQAGYSMSRTFNLGISVRSSIVMSGWNLDLAPISKKYDWNFSFFCMIFCFVCSS